MSKIKNGGLDQYGAEPFEQQQFGTTGVEGVSCICGLFWWGKKERDEGGWKSRRLLVSVRSDDTVIAVCSVGCLLLHDARDATRFLYSDSRMRGASLTSAHYMSLAVFLSVHVSALILLVP